MSAETLPQDVQALLKSHVNSYEDLTILLFLYRERAREWSEEELSASLSIPAQMAHLALANLRTANLIGAASDEPSARYRYAATGAIDCTVSRLASEYAVNPVRVVRIMTATAIARMRTSALRAFADAFLLKKDKDRG